MYCAALYHMGELLEMNYSSTAGYIIQIVNITGQRQIELFRGGPLRTEFDRPVELSRRC